MDQRDADLKTVDTLYDLVEQKRVQLSAIENRIELALSDEDVETWSRKWDETQAAMIRLAKRASELNCRAWHANHVD